MFNLDPFILAFLSFFIVIGPLIFFHELGHFLAARLNGIQVEEFGIGYPPRMVTLFERNGTKYTLNWLPLGGFMRPAGEDDPDVMGGFSSSSRLARITVLAAGPGANFLVAFVLLVVMFMVGAPEPQPGALIVNVEPGSPAETAGLLAEDVIVAADGVVLEGYRDLISYISQNLDKDIDLTILRGGEELVMTVTPRQNPPEGQGPTGIEIQEIVNVQKYGLFAAIGRAGQELAGFARTFVEIPRMVIERQFPARYLRPVSIVGISQMGGQVLDNSLNENALWPIIQFTAYISVALAVTNLLPIPALDGGRIFFIIVEILRGRRVDPRREMVVHFIGFAVLVTMMLVFVYLDIVDPLVTP